MSEYAPLRDAFNELNRLLIDKQQWDAQHEQQTQDMGIKRMMVESQLQDSALKRKGLELESKQAELQMRPTKANLYQFMPNNGAMQEMIFEGKDPSLVSNLAKTWGGERIDRVTGDVLDSSGRPIELPAFEIGNKSSAAMALLHGALSPATMIRANQDKLSEAMAAKKSALNAIPDNPMNKQKRGVIQNDINGLKAQWEKHEQMKSPDGMINLLNQQIEVANGFANQAVQLGANKNFVDLIKNQTDNLNAQVLSWQKQKQDIQREKNAHQAALAAPMPLYAYKLGADGKTTEGTRLMFVTKKDLGKSLRPMDVSQDLDQTWVWDPTHGKGSGSGEKQPFNTVPWVNSYENVRAGVFGKPAGNGIEIYPQNTVRDLISRRISGEVLPGILAQSSADLMGTPVSTVADKVNAKAKSVVDDWYAMYAKAYYKSNEDKQAAEELMLPYAQEFMKKWGVLPAFEYNHYIYPQFSMTNAPPTPGRVDPSNEGNSVIPPNQLDLK